jgi:GH24 family phage-related lysozyme (muramidase)
MLIGADDYFPFAREFEGDIPWLYLDTVGDVAIGIGHMIPDANAMSVVPLAAADGTSASDSEKRAAYLKVKAAQDKVGQAASVFQSLSPLRLAKGGDQALFQGNFDELFAEAQKLFQNVAGGFAAWPKEAQLATFDMAYNLGPDRLYKLFPTFREKGLAKRDYLECARQCTRGEIGQARNDWTKSQFEKAAKAVTG